MTEMTEQEWAAQLYKLASEAAEARVQKNIDVDSRLRTAKYAKSKWVDPNTYFMDYYKFLANKYPYGKTSDEDFGDLMEMKALDISNWASGKGPSPKDIKKSIEAAEFIKLLKGVAPEGQDWMSIGQDALKDKAVMIPGWKVNTPERFNEFLKQLGQYQLMYDRGKLAEETKNMPYMGLFSLAYPSVYQEAENAIATGEGGDPSTIYKLMGLDLASNAGIFAAPSTNVFKAPMANAMLGAGIQAGIEAERQMGKEAFSKTGQEFDTAPILLAGGAGATRPALVGAAQQTISKVPGKTASDVARGMAKSIRTGDAVDLERRRLEAILALWNKHRAPVQSTMQAVNPSAAEIYQLRWRKPYLYKQLMETKKVPEMARLFNVEIPENKVINTKQMLEMYDRPMLVRTKEGKDFAYGIAPRDFHDTPVGVARPTGVETIQNPKPITIWPFNIGPKKIRNYSIGPTKVGPFKIGKNENTIVLDEETEKLMRELFPAKYTDAMEETGASAFGKKVLGPLFGDVGSRFEPTFKVGGGKLGVVPENYKETDWYKKLGKTPEGKEAQKIIDEAFARSKAEREGTGN